jgi:hypothetical protein
VSFSSTFLVVVLMAEPTRPRAALVERPTADSLRAALAAVARSLMRSLWSISFTCACKRDWRW